MTPGLRRKDQEKRPALFGDGSPTSHWQQRVAATDSLAAVAALDHLQRQDGLERTPLVEMPHLLWQGEIGLLERDVSFRLRLRLRLQLHRLPSQRGSYLRLRGQRRLNRQGEAMSLDASDPCLVPEGLRVLALVVPVVAAQIQGVVETETRCIGLSELVVEGCCTAQGEIGEVGYCIGRDGSVVAVCRIDLDELAAGGYCIAQGETAEAGCCIDLDEPVVVGYYTPLGPEVVGYDTGRDEQGLGHSHSRHLRPDRLWEGHEVETLAAPLESTDAVEGVERTAGKSAVGPSIVALVSGRQRCAVACPAKCQFLQYRLRHIGPRYQRWAGPVQQRVSPAAEANHAGHGLLMSRRLS